MHSTSTKIRLLRKLSRAFALSFRDYCANSRHNNLVEMGNIFIYFFTKELI